MINNQLKDSWHADHHYLEICKTNLSGHPFSGNLIFFTCFTPQTSNKTHNSNDSHSFVF